MASDTNYLRPKKPGFFPYDCLGDCDRLPIKAPSTLILHYDRTISPLNQSTMLTVGLERIQMPPGSTVTLPHQTWDDYETLLASRRDDAAIKIRFNVHTQQISLMAPMAGHGNTQEKAPCFIKNKGF